jgi:hypothetical protein
MPHLHHISYILEKVSKKSLTQWNEYSDAVKEYFYQNYIYYAQKRSEMLSDLSESLLNECIQCPVHDWQRVVSYQYSLNPLSTQGSIKNPFGGRFNIGNIEPTIFPPFGALYLAEDRDTGIKEKYGFPPSSTKQSGLTLFDINLTKKESQAIVVVSGNINVVLDLSTPKSLEKFFQHIKKIKSPKHLVQVAKKLKIEHQLTTIQTFKQLYQTVFDENWRYHASLCNVPANSQTVGQIAYESGIEGILYPSTKDGKKCLAVFPRNFQNKDSYLGINPEHAPKEIMRDLLNINKDSFKNFI